MRLSFAAREDAVLTRRGSSDANRADLRAGESDASLRLFKSAQVLATELDDEVVLLDLRSGLYFSLNSVAAFAWNQLDGTKSFDELLASICRRFAVAPETARLDLAALVDELRSHGLVKNA